MSTKDTKKEGKCEKLHCRCMNLKGQCPNHHYSECMATENPIERFTRGLSSFYEKVDAAKIEIDDAHSEIGTLLRETRLALGKTLRQMARELKISAAYLSDVELGKRGVSGDLFEIIKTKYGKKQSNKISL